MIVRLLLAATLLTAAIPYPPSPQQRFGDLFHAVQMRSVFPDGKTFVDAVPRRSDAAIMAAWRSCRCGDDTTALRRFVLAHFIVPESASPRQQPRRALTDHIDRLWPHLTRSTPTVPAGSSALTLPRRYVVPGGRFREMYYWDSWFSMLGLPLARRQDLVEDMVVDFGSLIDR